MVAEQFAPNKPGPTQPWLLLGRVYTSRMRNRQIRVQKYEKSARWSFRGQIKVRERKPLPKASVNLQAARKVVSAGRGVSRQADLAMVEQLAGLLGAEVGCTRPLAEGLDWLPRERYIGISGAHIKPDLYFGVGVSGQVQHMIGMNGSRVVVAVNKDANAPIFTQADYGIVTDLYTFIPALIKALQARN